MVDVTVSIVRRRLEELDRRLTEATFPDLHGFIGDTFAPILGSGYLDLTDRLIALKTATGATASPSSTTMGRSKRRIAPGAAANMATGTSTTWSRRSRPCSTRSRAPSSCHLRFAGGGSILHIRADDTFRWNFNQYAITALSNDPNVGTVTVQIVFDGSFEGVITRRTTSC